MGTTEAEVVADLAQKAYEPQELENGSYYVLRKADGNLEFCDRTNVPPARKTGTVTVTDVDSFAAYYGKHGDEFSEVFADVTKSTMTAVLDAHQDSVPRHQGHRLVLALDTTPQWKTWLEHNSKPLSQQAFADFIDANYGDVAPEAEPIHLPGGVTLRNVSAADLRELAQHLTASVDATIANGQRIDNGATRFTFTENIEVRGGQKGEFEVPAAFLLAVKPYDDCPDDTRIIARLKTRHNRETGTLTVTYTLFEAVKVLREAFDAVVDSLAHHTDCNQILNGQPSR